MNGECVGSMICELEAMVSKRKHRLPDDAESKYSLYTLKTHFVSFLYTVVGTAGAFEFFPTGERIKRLLQPII